MKLRTLLLCTSLVLVAAAAATAATGTPQVVARIQTGSRPCSEAGGFGAVWVGNNGSSSLTRIDPATNQVTGKVRVGAGPCGSLVAKELAGHGFPVVVLEAGPRLDPARDLPNSEANAAKILWNRPRAYADRLRIEEHPFETLEQVRDWRKTGREAA